MYGGSGRRVGGAEVTSRGGARCRRPPPVPSITTTMPVPWGGGGTGSGLTVRGGAVIS